MLQRFGGLTQAVIRVRQIIARGGAIASAGAVLRDIIGQRNRCLLIRRLHILHFSGGVEQRILLRGDIHIHLRKVLRVRQIFVHIAGFDIECLQRIEGGVGFFGSRIFLYRLAVCGDSLFRLIEVAIQHSALQRRFARERGVGIRGEQLLVGTDSTAFVLLLQLRTGNLIDAVIRIIGLRIALHQVAQHGYLLAVLMLQAERIAALEERVIGSHACRLLTCV